MSFVFIGFLFSALAHLFVQFRILKQSKKLIKGLEEQIMFNRMGLAKLAELIEEMKMIREEEGNIPWKRRH